MANSAFRQDPSSTGSFDKIRGIEPVVGNAQPAHAVVIGGGTGAPVSIRTLVSMGVRTSAVVAMADDGGSTGALRELANVTPPGDIRKCLVAFADDPHDPLTRAFKYRFELANNHALGNLLITALEDATGSFPEAIRICEDLLHARGHVYPSTLDKVTLCGRTLDGRIIEGQANISHSRTAIESVWLKAPYTGTPYPAAIKAICEADLIVLGPGSLFTSIIPNLLIPGVLEAIRSSRAKTVFVCSVADFQGETWGFSAEEHVRALQDHGMAGLLDYVLVHTPVQLRPGGHEPGNYTQVAREEPLPSDYDGSSRVRPVPITYDAAYRIQESGPVVIARDFVDPAHPTIHNPIALRDALTGVLKLCRSPQM
ncbi:MAG: YvcK family protein [Eggerthellaceae bacterium]|nr:YvcK family protein [Eggerthellaceae bacterium]